MDKEKIHRLAQEYLDGTLLPAGWEELKDHLLREEAHPEFQAELQYAIENNEYAPADPLILAGILRQIREDFRPRPLPAPPDPLIPSIRRLRTYLKYAAAVILLAGLGTWFYFNERKNIPPTAGTTPVRDGNDIAPGGDRAVLTLSDGTTITLDSVSNGPLAWQGGMQVVKLPRGRLSYLTDAGHTTGNGKESRNTLTTPKGGQYQLILPDGTHVWLNASSSLTYPTVFTDNERTVAVTGEAYFEIAKDKSRPFLVNINDRTRIEVLGTQFNVNAYSNEPGINTTLLEGSVRMISGAENAVLQPGQQARLTQHLTIIDNIDVDQQTAWKNGRFDFNGLDLPTIMRQLERWYDIDVKYAGPISHEVFEGRLTRDLSLSQVLKILTKMEVTWQLEGRTLTITH